MNNWFEKIPHTEGIGVRVFKTLDVHLEQCSVVLEGKILCQMQSESKTELFREHQR